ncbi:calcineurin-like phosphoesterase [Ferrigenium kumadai]|uniref:Calcineurin-like phosphoesterase n=1 Tax=Ferrigenium kumadai TaxID=1682490 RepID=A0AAN1SZR3_9PROT|nr:metallophosphoesterase [Ferrigenium kumadai]BBI99968.1 calcineurin-like phosphoesterase [Ferrigenium kumadai]
MFGVILIFAVTLMQGYVFWRAASVPFVRRRISRKGLAGLGFVLWVLFMLGRVSAHEDSGSLAAMLELLGMTWMAVLFLMSVSLLAVEAATGFGIFLARFAPTLRGAALVVGGALSAVALIQGLRPPVVQSYDVYLDGLPGELDGTVIVALSDLHLGPVLGEGWLAARIAQVREERPDIVVLLGDVFEGHGAPGKELLAVLRRLSAPMGIWAVLGNHEFHGNRSNTAWFEAAGIHVLRDTWVELRPGLVLAGVDDLTNNNAADSLAKALAGRPTGVTVLLSHAPLPEDVVAGKGVNLLLSGHTHGGQVWPFGYLVEQRFPLLEGRYEFEGMTAIVSRGMGTWGPPMRLWRPAEILRVTLHGGTRTPHGM